ncbi:TonB-dependent receptor [Sporomusa sp. KB1]|jgi:iron complex outermembrane receptor protein|uniref:TonB-dependent receptor n=1 Tax=Sporomusa sp. KB1 TaxID=943346 RepID=UPI0011AD1B15|nr:TonB-dependent receptor plug domain-containing protein [Sporomusa sp. KB1]TWH45530.1 iron complex outermembrane receptor protein [Sporomusa sp. KB1]
MKHNKLLAALIVSSIVSGGTVLPVQAQESDKENTTVLSDVLVTGKKIATPAKEAAHTMADPVDVRLAVPESSKIATETFTQEDIEKMHPKDILELIQNGMGLNVMRYGAKGYCKVETRGGDEIGYIIDGVWLPETQASRMLMNLPVDMIESITFCRDASILTMGPVASFAQTNVKSGAPAQGYIIITTMTPTKPVDKAKVSYGTFNAEKASYVHGDKIGDTGYYTLGYAKDKTDGMDGWNNSQNLNTYLFKIGDKGKDWVANLTLLYNEGDVHNKAYFNSVADSYALNITAANKLALGGFLPIKTTVLALNAAKKWDEHHTTDFSFGWSHVDSYRWALNGDPITKKAGGFYERDYLRQLNLGHTLDYGRDKLKFGTQLMWYDAPTGMGSYGGSPREEELYGFYLYGERKATDKVILDVSARLDKKHITSGIGKYLVGSTSIVYDQLFGEMWEGNSVSTSVGAAYQINKVYKATARLGYSQQADNDFALVDNNEKLGDEKRIKCETGMEANYSKALNASLTAFYYDIDNARVATGNKYYESWDTAHSYPVYSYTARDLQRRGFELGFHGDLTDHFGYKASYAYFTSSDALDNSRTPHNLYNIALNYKNKDLSANLMLHHNSQYRGTASGVNAGSGTDFNMDRVTTIDININKELNANTTLTLFGNNITDQRYATGMYVYDTGATYGVQISKQF